MNDLIKRMRAAREHWIELDETRAVCVLRPRWEDLVAAQRAKSHSAFIREFAVGWRGVTEADLVPSGGDIEAPFDAEVCAEWLADRPMWATKVAEWLLTACNERIRQEGEAAKN